MEMIFPVEPPPPPPPRREVARMAPVGWGFVFVPLSLVASYFDLQQRPDAYIGLYTSIVGAVGAVFWLMCLYRMHRIIQQVTDGTYQVTPGMAAGYHFIPFLNLWWCFHWPMAFAGFIRGGGVRILPGFLLGFLHFAFLLTKFLDGSLSLALTMCLMLYLNNRLRLYLVRERYLPGPVAGRKRRWRRWVFGGLGGVLLLVLLFFVVIGVGVTTGHFADSAAVPAGKIHPRQLRQLREMGVVADEERVQYFYSASLLSIHGDGNLFTDWRVISYQELDGELEIAWAGYDEIAGIEFLPGAAYSGDSIVEITLHDESWFVLYVSREGRGDERFHERLLRLWETRRVTDEEPGGQS